MDLEFSIKDKILYGKPLQKNVETESIGTLLLRNLNNFPDHIGQINAHTGEKTTFAEFKDRSIRCALWLRKQGIGKGDVVGTSISLQNDDYVPVLATLFVGAIINPWLYQITPLAAEYFFELVKPKVMFAWEEGIDILVSAAKKAQIDCKFVVLGKHCDYPSLIDLMAEQDQIEIDQFHHTEPKDPKTEVSVMLFTSGTTSNPKAVMISNQTLVNQSSNIPWRNLLQYSNFSWISGFNSLITCITSQSTRILHSEFDAEETGEVIEKFKVNTVLMNPADLTQLYKSDVLKKYDFSNLAIIFLRGNKASNSILESSRTALPNTHIINVYGMTETGGALTFQMKNYMTKNSVGRLIEGAQLKVVDPKSGLLLDANQEGELCFKSNSLMIGYLNDPQETKKAIDEEGWLHSGDLGYYDENGEIWIVDRLKQILILHGANLSLSKIEELLLQHPAVIDVAVVPVKHKIDNERPFAFVVKKPGAEVTSDELKELPGRFDKRMRLTAGVKLVDEIPYKANGKKSLEDLKKMAQLYAEK